MAESRANEQPFPPATGEGEGAGVAGEDDGGKKSFKSAVCIIPPESVWQQIQEIRKDHDKAYERWMPHINLLYPFLPDHDDGEIFRDSATKIGEALAKVKPFTVHFSRHALGYFLRKRMCTLWLQPLEESGSGDICQSNDTAHSSGSTEVRDHHPGVLQIQSILESTFPLCSDLSTISDAGFQPHLSLGQFKASRIKKACEEYKANWEDFSFEVKEVHLISRRDFHDPFHVRHSVPLGGNAR